jgi:hypothetical protein
LPHSDRLALRVVAARPSVEPHQHSGQDRKEGGDPAYDEYSCKGHLRCLQVFPGDSKPHQDRPGFDLRQVR